MPFRDFEYTLLCARCSITLREKIRRPRVFFRTFLMKDMGSTRTDCRYRSATLSLDAARGEGCAHVLFFGLLQQRSSFSKQRTIFFFCETSPFVRYSLVYSDDTCQLFVYEYTDSKPFGNQNECGCGSETRVNHTVRF